ncbi:MAG: hypothetical protein WDW38_009135 [Sanguina aurantia]
MHAAATAGTRRGAAAPASATAAWRTRPSHILAAQCPATGKSRATSTLLQQRETSREEAIVEHAVNSGDVEDDVESNTLSRSAPSAGSALPQLQHQQQQQQHEEMQQQLDQQLHQQQQHAQQQQREQEQQQQQQQQPSGSQPRAGQQAANPLAAPSGVNRAQEWVEILSSEEGEEEAEDDDDDDDVIDLT